MARRYGVLPSEILSLEGDEFQFNLLVLNKGVEDENKRAKESAQKAAMKRRR
jgi:hypothetical protein